MSIDRESVLSALMSVKAPGSNQGIVELGYVKDLAADSGISLSVVFPGPLTPARRAVKQQCEDALSGLGGGTVELRSEIPASFTGEGGMAPGVRNFIAVGSGKGGVGKSTIAANLAVGLAKAGARVGLLDTDVYGPSVPLLMGVTRQAFMEKMQLEPSREAVLLPYTAHGVATLSLGYLVDPEKAAIWRGPMVHGALMQLLRDCRWGTLDYLILDLPPGTGDVQLSLSQNLTLGGAVIVCTPQPVALADARKAVNLLRTTKTEVLGIVENMAYHACSECGHEDSIFGTQGAKDAAEEWDIPFLGSLPLDTHVRVSGDKGRPLLSEDDPSGPLADGLWHIIDRITFELASRTKARPRTLPITRS